MNECVIAVVYCVLDMLKYYFCLLYVFDIRITRRKYAVVALITTASIVSGLCYWLTGGSDNCCVIPNVFMLLFVFLLQKGNRLKGALYVVLAWMIMDTLTELVKMFASTVGFGQDILFKKIAWESINAKLCAILIIFAYHGVVNILIRKRLDYSFRTAQWGVIFVCFLGLVLIIPPLERMSNGRNLSSEEYVRMCISLMLVLFLFIGVMLWQSYIVKKNLSMNERELRYQYVVKSQAAYFEGLLNDYTEIRKFRHDMKAHVTALTELATDSKNEKILEYLKSIDAKLACSAIKSYTGNKAVDAVINELAKHMEESKIKFEYEGVLRNREDVQDFDFCTIFYNVLQNAIEASKALDEDKREVSVEVKSVGDKAGILISNNTLLEKIPVEKEGRFTTKKDKENHGFGIQNIKDVVKKHDGIYEARIADSRYIVTIVI
ncbi:GHKL domain-containing protein [Butyrivibrio sp. M55]|uniref:GHKL domain-containing protein n=1 Tax=Butyrivibrio sp. M55 TaxID=1855323 RepID=UPI0008E99573|nr:GHKL domain-containing protein [Butyrivibrio sp. M55]SFU87877.1 GHKL domain-containing protein [Butyrivibrio sp. M55]